jgi:phosphatidylserine/phosphatidylglycerophosphate/cardiolipin synthase-like enzyme
MNPADLDRFLTQSLADRKLSGSERTALAAWLADHVTTDQQRGVVRHRVFELAKSAGPSADVIDWLEDVLKVVAPVQAGRDEPGRSPSASPSVACFSPGDACLGQIVHRFAAARRSADVCVFTITDDRITRSLLDAHRRGVAVRVITDNEKAYDPGSDVERIRAAGVPLLVDHTPYHMHHKFALFDRVRLITGSYNWTRGAAEGNEENLIDTADPELVAAFGRAFDALWEKLS